MIKYPTTPPAGTAPGPESPARATLVLGLGNDVLGDDAIGLHVVRALCERLADATDVVVRETTEMGLALLDFMVGYRRVVLVDSIQTGTAPPGFVHEIQHHDLKTLPARTPHFLGVGETLALGRMLGLPMPEQVTILAVEVADPFTLGSEMSPALRLGLPGIVDRLLAVIGSEAGKPADHRGDATPP